MASVAQTAIPRRWFVKRVYLLAWLGLSCSLSMLGAWAVEPPPASCSGTPAYKLAVQVSLDAIEGEGAKGKKKERKPPALKSTAERQNALRNIVWDDMSEYLRDFADGKKLLNELERLLIAA
jgi:hypothetical protein